MTTPEGQVKVKINAILERYPVYVFKPVQFGMGKRGLDYHCMVEIGGLPLAFFIEAKEPGEELTEIQNDLATELRRKYKANVFKIDGPYGLNLLDKWLSNVCKAGNDTAAKSYHQY